MYNTEPSYLQKAKELATKAHKGQHRWGGEPYITHPEAVAEMVDTFTEKQVAWLHDVVEDTNVSLKDLTDYGFSETVVEAVDAITKRKGEEEYDEYIERVARNDIATEVKIADITHNLSCGAKGSMGDKYRLAIKYLELRKLVKRAN
jgi:(p)ppGpp synthase/HD superfamily hydrolase